MPEDIKQVAWNASQGLIMELSNRRSYANTFFINGDIKKAFKTLVSIKQSVIQSFNKKQREQLTAIESKFNEVSSFLSKSTSNSFNKNIRKVNFLSNVVATQLYSNYNELLMDLLGDYGYLIGEKTDSSKMRF